VPPERSIPRVVPVLALAGGLGLLPSATGALDPVAACAWLALFAPAAGILAGAEAPRRVLVALLVPAAWALGLALVGAREPRALPTPHWAACALVGLFAAGWALGVRVRAPLGAAGHALFLGLVLAGASSGFGLLAGGSELARAHPEAARRLLDLSPLVLVLESAGRDWTHAQPELYARSGVEWVQRRPYPGNLAGPAVLVVGCALAWLARAAHRAR
jgi:hypothetical protein